MKVLAILIVAVTAVTTGTAMSSAARSPAISQHAIAGIKLGMSGAQVMARLGKPSETRGGTFDNPGQPDGWTALVYSKKKVAVYFDADPQHLEKAIMVTTWNPAHRTATGAGPCTPIARLKKLYRSTIKPNPHNTAPDGTVYGYEVGKDLMFGADGAPPTPSDRVTAVGLYNGAGGDSALGLAGFVTDSESNC